MSDVFTILGLDPDDLKWQDLALCSGQEVSRFYEKYESNARVARLTDQVCLSCPVRTQCLQAGVENNEWGVWGGVYLSNGKRDDTKNSHKTKEIWDQIKAGLS